MYLSAHSRHTRTLSPPLSATGSSQVTTTQQPKLNVVTRLAIEGKVKQAHDGAALKVYLKLSIPMDNVSPGSTVPLFPEENLKLLSAQVHPLDTNSAPYHFSSTTCPVLNNAARALNLPMRSSKSYLSLFGVSTSVVSMHSNRSSASTSTTNIPPLDDKYTGHIIVSGYNISYILPKDFPPRFWGDEAAPRVSTFSAAKMRQGSVSERCNMHFMAAVDLFVPFTSRPPRAPFLISVPIPRCLSNTVNLRIFPSTSSSVSTSVASLSSAEEDPGAWELTSEPHVTRTTSRPTRTGSYGDMADDESSDSSTYADGASGGIVIQGTFPSTDRLRVRWAQPTRTVADNGDGRRRVGVREAKGDMNTRIMGKARDSSSGREGVLMKIEYKGICKGVWFPGVATMLGMDVGLESGGSDVVWAPGEEAGWSVSGGDGYTGFDVGSPSSHVLRQPSPEFPPAPTNNRLLHAPSVFARHDSSSSTSSLLRAPLPAEHVPDYSFEGSPTSTPSGTLSSISSMPLTSGGRSRATSDARTPRLPVAPITIHINMNDIIPPAQNVFTFTISGTILVISEISSNLANGPNLRSENEMDLSPIVLPRFVVLAADSKSTSTIIRNETEDATIEVYNISGDLRDAQTRRTVLQRNAMTRCGSDGGRIALRSISVPRRSRSELVLESSRLSPRSKTPTGQRESAIAPPPPVNTQVATGRRRRNGPLQIPSVNVVVTPLLLGGSRHSNAHAVRLRLHAPSDADSDWLEFGLAKPAGFTTPSGSSPSDSTKQSQVDIDIISVNVDGTPVRFESSAPQGHDESTAVNFGASFHEKSRGDWITWVRIEVGEQGGLLLIDYIVKQIDDGKAIHDVKGKVRARNKSHLDILIPTFALAIGRIDVTIESTLEIDSLCSNFAHSQDRRILHYSLREFFRPRVTLLLRLDAPRNPVSYSQLGRGLMLLLGLLPVVLVSVLLVNLGSEFKQMRHSFDQAVALRSLEPNQFPRPATETVVVTTTVFTSPPGLPMSNTSPTLTSSTSMTMSNHPPWSDTNFPSSSSRSLEQPVATVATGSSESSSSPLSGDSLFVVTALPFEWTIPVDFIPVAHNGWNKLLGGLSVVWEAFRKVYHYPLDPP